MRAYRPSGFSPQDSETDLLATERAKRIPRYAQRVENGLPLFEDAAKEEPKLPVLEQLLRRFHRKAC